MLNEVDKLAVVPMYRGSHGSSVPQLRFSKLYNPSNKISEIRIRRLRVVVRTVQGCIQGCSKAALLKHTALLF